MPTEELTTCTKTYQLSTASGQMKVGQRLTVSNRTITRLSFEMYKYSPGDITTKKLYYEIRDPNDGYSLIQSKDTGFELLLNGSYAWYEAILDTPQYLDREVWIGVSWEGLGVDDIVYVRFDNVDRKSGEYFVYASHALVWGPNAGWDTGYKYTYYEGPPIGMPGLNPALIELI